MAFQQAPDKPKASFLREKWRYSKPWTSVKPNLYERKGTSKIRTGLKLHFYKRKPSLARSDESGVGHPPQTRLARNTDFSGYETPLRKRPKSCNPYLSRCANPPRAIRERHFLKSQGKLQNVVFSKDMVHGRGQGPNSWEK